MSLPPVSEIGLAGKQDLARDLPGPRLGYGR
jgi:hypothetical protein